MAKPTDPPPGKTFVPDKPAAPVVRTPVTPAPGSPLVTPTETPNPGSFPRPLPDSAFVPKPDPNVKTVVAEEQHLENCPKGTLVRLLVPIFDGVKRIEADTEIYWPHDEPPLRRTAVHAGEKQTPLDAPAMTDGKPPRDYIDPETGERPVIETT